MSSVGEIEMILLGFREASLALKLEKRQSHSILQCTIYFLGFILLPAGDNCLLPAHKGTPDESKADEPILMSLGGVLPSS